MKCRRYVKRLKDALLEPSKNIAGKRNGYADPPSTKQCTCQLVGGRLRTLHKWLVVELARCRFHVYTTNGAAARSAPVPAAARSAPVLPYRQEPAGNICA